MQNCKIRFIEPNGAPSNIFSKFMNIPLLGPIYLSTIANRLGYDSQVLNENILGRNIYDSELLEADILCLSCITATINRGIDIARQYKKMRKSHNLPSKTILGGIHASMLPNELKDQFDQIVCGEAELLFPEILKNNNSEPLVHSTRVLELDELPIPDYSLLRDNHKITVWPVMTSRGCPHDCNFCSVTRMFGKKYRAHSVERVIEEVSQIKKKWIFFVDDNFTANILRTNQILDEFIKYKFHFRWSAQVRAEIARNKDLVKKMYVAGCRIVYIGFESINNYSLEHMNKNQSLNDIQNAIKTFQTHGIQVHGMFMLGNDPDSKDIFKATSTFCHKQKLSYAHYSVLTPLPGTEIFEEYKNKNRLLHTNWNLYDGLHVVFKPNQMTPAELQHGMLSCFYSFYSFKSTLRQTIASTLTIIKNRNATLQTFYPAFIRFTGRLILQQWNSSNKSYLNYLNTIS
jgi:radical SAM superfamily enzyme YgiQ (UPF0313 family)